MPTAALVNTSFPISPGRVTAFCIAATLISTLMAAQAATPLTREEFVIKASAETGWTPSELTNLLDQAEDQPHILELISRPAEKAIPWHVYRSRVVTPERVAEGKAFMGTYSEALNRAEATYGVPKEIIAAIIGVETRYGANRGQYRVLDSLTTLSFHFPRRAAFFQKELTAFLALAKAGDIDPKTLRGSYAGAFGWPQFMPTSVRKMGVDFDGDGAIDLYNSPIDAIGSVAKYFSCSGWKKGGKVATLLHFKNGSNLELEGEDGPLYFKVEHNFKVILKYNHSNLYSMAVYRLSEQLK